LKEGVETKEERRSEETTGRMTRRRNKGVQVGRQRLRKRDREGHRGEEAD
jgi:hypothetical protein